MEEKIKNGEEYYDIVILDPPKLAPTNKDIPRASRKYQSLNMNAIKLLDPINGGILLTCTCSSAIAQKNGGEYFISLVKNAAIMAKREIKLLSIHGAAPCHTTNPGARDLRSKYLEVAMFSVGGLGLAEISEKEKEKEKEIDGE